MIMSPINVVLDLFVSLGLEIEQMNVVIAFLQSNLDEEIYMEKPKFFDV